VILASSRDPKLLDLDATSFLGYLDARSVRTAPRV
jgi:hypothetical protein